MKKSIFSSVVDYDEQFDEYFLQFPQQLISTYNLQEGDTVKYTIENNSIIMQFYDGESDVQRFPVGGEISTKVHTSDYPTRQFEISFSDLHKPEEDT